MTRLSALAFVLFPAAFAAGAEPNLAPELYRETSHAGESLDAFVIRITPRALLTTWDLHAEVCGSIDEVDGRFHIALRTDHAELECRLPPDTKLSLHTHAPGASERFSRADYARPGYLITSTSVKYQDGGRAHRVALVRRVRGGFSATAD